MHYASDVCEGRAGRRIRKRHRLRDRTYSSPYLPLSAQAKLGKHRVVGCFLFLIGIIDSAYSSQSVANILARKRIANTINRRAYRNTPLTPLDEECNHTMS